MKPRWVQGGPTLHLTEDPQLDFRSASRAREEAEWLLLLLYTHAHMCAHTSQDIAFMRLTANVLSIKVGGTNRLS